MTLPDDVLALLGLEPHERTADRQTARRVWAGGGYVAVVAPAEVVERELWVLRHPGMPLAVPSVVADGPGWYVAGEIVDAVADWTPTGLRAALLDLARLHDVFSGAVPPSAPLRRPFSGAGLDELLGPARAGSVAASLPEPLTGLLADPAPLLEVLAGQPETLLHGDPWPGNIRRPGVPERVWVDWEQAAAGAAAADVASWLDQAPWALPPGAPFSLAEQLAAYCGARPGLDAEDFGRAVDAAGVLWFFGFDVPRLEEGDIDTAFADTIIGARLAAAQRALM